MKKRTRTQHGFTLMEMLIVVAIIAVLVAIAIPTMNKSLHKAREMADLANVRTYYDYLQADYLTTGKYLPFGISWEYNVTDTIQYQDGTSVKLQTGVLAVSCPPPDKSDETSGYQVYYMCNQGDFFYTFGASN